ncbi:ATP synthase F1 subunit epsilon [Desulfomonile tiedjei]|uniref:ATP synthase epsilon chain n=1 Tax=Desulfomonile tiedjei (strain ATCC 49306 / DSM 6799 / DCB-1) TaxID=706587 RepID=I4C9V8_DESTA|nr:ATP synthase F1 subunit epsilon [Desulfomonile tiedjei]AFM26349.1 ATP synthase, F1 epsilon subunit [Desulfomonile tiedjei DSM 6799]
MSDKLFKVQVVTPTGVVLDKEVEEIVAPGIMGEFGVLIGHTPMLTFIKPGIFSYLENDRFVKFAVGAGFCEVLKDSVSVLVDEAYRAEDINTSDVQADIQNLERQLAELDQAADPEGFKRISDKLKVARVKSSLTA